MFKSTENPSIELLSSNSTFIRKSLQFATDKRITRVIIHSKDPSELFSIDKIAAEYPTIAIWVKIDAEYVNSSIEKQDYIEVIIRTTQKIGITKHSDNIFWEMDLGIGEKPLDNFLDNEMILWHLSFDRAKWEMFDSQINQLFYGYVNHDLMIDNVLLTIDLIKEHPCNVYLCSGMHCHSEHGNVPRCILIDSKGNLYPYGIIHKSLLMGNIFSDTNIIEKYNSSKEKKHFIEMNRKLYLSILDKCNYFFIPWFEILGGMITSDC